MRSSKTTCTKLVLGKGCLSVGVACLHNLIRMAGWDGAGATPLHSQSSSTYKQTEKDLLMPSLAHAIPYALP